MSTEVGSEVLSQSEVEAILASINAGEQAAPQQLVGGKPRKPDAKVSITNFDFRSPSFLTPAQLRRLRIKHEEFIRALGASLTMFLRLDFAVQMSRLETIPYRQMLDALPAPNHLTIFRLKPLNGLCLLDISPRLGLTLVDRLLGGPGHGVKIEREFTDIERTVLDNVVSHIIRDYTNSWLKYQTLEYEIVESEVSAKFLSIVPDQEIMLFLEMEARFGDCVAGLRLMIPFRAIEGILSRMMAEITQAEDDKSRPISIPADKKSSLFDVPVPVSIHWRGFSMGLDSIRGLEPGDVLLLDQRHCETAQVDLGSIPSFSAKVDRRDGRVRATITGKLS
jgi:flagellar motor switch protein FliM